jgi:hypothetical protein
MPVKFDSEYWILKKFMIDLLKRRSIVILFSIMGTKYGFSQNNIDSIQEKIVKHDGSVKVLDERVLLNENDLEKPTSFY